MQPVSEIDVEDMVNRALEAQSTGSDPVEYLQGMCVDMAEGSSGYADDLYDACMQWAKDAGGW